MAEKQEEQVLPTYTSMAGAWLLDRSRSGSMAEYLRILGTPEQAVQIQIAREQTFQLRNAIVLNESALVIYRKTAVISFTHTLDLIYRAVWVDTADQEIKSFIWGEELVMHSTLGTRRSTASFRESGQLNGFVITSSFNSPAGEAFLVESWNLAEEGRIHVQEINLRNLSTGEGNITRRVWVRVPMTDEDREHLLAG